MTSGKLQGVIIAKYGFYQNESCKKNFDLGLTAILRGLEKLSPHSCSTLAIWDESQDPEL